MKSKGLAAVLALLFGAIGAHWFYLGKETKGLIYLLVWIFGWALMGIPTLIIGLIAFVDFLVIAFDDSVSFHNKYNNDDPKVL
jgi:TM2 domain-containing membrane protein YozV